MKMFEYMAAERPIVATDFPVIREVLQDGINAVLVPPDSAEALRSGIVRILGNTTEANRLAQQARRDVLRYTWTARVDQILKWAKWRCQTGQD
jgi:glycosyltransferase involved in cell wall biosynthesis